MSHTLYGAQFSYYSGKARSYLLHKRIAFTETTATAWIYLRVMPQKVGAAVVPVVHTPSGEWLQDTSVIIDTLEARYRANPALPATPVLRMAAYLFELWGDEFLLPLAMHTRWNRPEHLPWYHQEAGSVLLPGWPGFLQRLMGRQIANGMQALRATLGFGPDMTALLERFGQIQLDALDAHFALYPFLLGGRPCIGDFGLIGPLYAHIGRDPLSRRDLIEPRPHLKAWIDRMFDPDSAIGGAFLSDDRVPPTLMPALRSIIDEMMPFLQQCGVALEQAATPQRFMGPVAYPMVGGIHRRHAASYPLWMAQRMRETFSALTPPQQIEVCRWLDEIDGAAVLQTALPQVRRSGLSARLA